MSARSVLGKAFAWACVFAGTAGSVGAANGCEVPGVRLPAGLPIARVVLDTELGEIAIAVDLKHAPLTGCNFLNYVAANAYSGGYFGRTVRPDNQSAAPVPIAVVQAYPHKDFVSSAPIALERTKDTSLRHLDGTVSMARKNPDDATDNFFVCIGAQPELDFGGRRNPDGQGFAAFGKIVRGMPLVLRIQNGAADGEKLTPPITIRAAHIVVP
jgi:peptidyl-prolyl cis-trans isomerase A (cyclophilin A)